MDIKAIIDREAALNSVFAPQLERRLNDLGVSISTIGGNCPVQAEGDIDGMPFYFRARGHRWRIEIGLNTPVTSHDCWIWDEKYGMEEFGAGWMPKHHALKFILYSVKKYIRYRDHIDGK